MITGAQVREKAGREVGTLEDKRSPTAIVGGARAMTLGFVAAALVLAGIYVWGTRHPHVAEHVGMALSAEGANSVEAEGQTYAIPLDVRWQERTGSWHFGGRPACLPPTGIGEVGPVRFGVVRIADDPGSWAQVVWVSCRA